MLVRLTLANKGSLLTFLLTYLLILFNAHKTTIKSAKWAVYSGSHWWLMVGIKNSSSEKCCELAL